MKVPSCWLKFLQTVQWWMRLCLQVWFAWGDVMWATEVGMLAKVSVKMLAAAGSRLPAAASHLTAYRTLFFCFKLFIVLLERCKVRLTPHMNLQQINHYFFYLHPGNGKNRGAVNRKQHNTTTLFSKSCSICLLESWTLCKLLKTLICWRHQATF